MKNITKYLLASICGLTTVVSVNASDFTGNSVTGMNDSNSTFASVGQEPCYAATVVKFTKGKAKNGISWVPDSRSDASKALGVPDKTNADGGFVSLGYNNSLT
ncbi:hypothetical protein QLR68_39650, partial [Micromonospora sp. DH15]|nr:hypothetical protein [Micromonospora sp. DH15]